MSKQSEAILEENLLKQLVSLRYEKVLIRDEAELLSNLKAQLERHNKTILDKIEFARILNHLNKSNAHRPAQRWR